MRKALLGCTADAQREHYTGSSYPTKRCPRRGIAAVGAVGAVVELYNHSDGKLGARVLDEPSVLVDALGYLCEGIAWKREQETK